MKYALVQFKGPNTRNYCYKTFLDVQRDDWVIVDSANGPGLARVTDGDVRNEAITKKATAPILAKVDVQGLQKEFWALEEMEIKHER